MYPICSGALDLKTIYQKSGQSLATSHIQQQQQQYTQGN